MAYIIKGKVVSRMRDGAATFRMYLVRPVPPATEARVRVCGRYQETGSRMKKDTCNSAGGTNSGVATTVRQNAARWEDLGNRALAKYIEEEGLPPPATGDQVFALDITEALENEANVF